jgi:hypothetical protein
MKKALFSLMLLGVAVIALGQEECCPDRTHTVGVGLSWILPNDVFITARFWLVQPLSHRIVTNGANIAPWGWKQGRGTEGPRESTSLG